MTDDVPAEFAGRIPVDLGEVLPEDVDAIIKALERAIKDKRCQAFFDEFKSGEMPDTLKRGFVGLLAHYSEHGENGGKIARLMRESGLIDDLPVMTGRSIDWGDATH